MMDGRHVVKLEDVHVGLGLCPALGAHVIRNRYLVAYNNIPRWELGTLKAAQVASNCT